METRQDFYVGLLIVVTIALVVGALIATSGWGERRYDLYLRVANAEGISQDTKALVQGLEVGRVRSISPTVDSASGTISFVARLSVAEKFADGSSLRLPIGTRAELDASTPLTPAHINLLLPDTVGRMRLYIDPGDTIRMSRRSSAMDKMAEVADELSQRVQDMVQEATRTLARVQSTLREVAPDVERTLGSVATTMGRVDSLVERLHRGGFADSLAATVAGTNRLLARLDTLARDAGALTTENRADLRATVMNLTEASRQLNHFVDQMTRRPYRALTGVKPLPRDSTGARP
ncbi:MAG TPA: MlaD family protein [Gemmatimonadales bacterium]|nr:MlaD family protein [Gemmatimonadales bacterium]